MSLVEVIEDENENLKLLTLQFWSHFLRGNFYLLESYLFSSCEIRNSFEHSLPPLVKGVLLSLDYLKEFLLELKQFKNKINIENFSSFIILKNKKQSRFIRLPHHLLFIPLLTMGSQFFGRQIL